ncbi:MAG: NAD-dependent epimerase/dehydratase family protein [Chitinophagales bacterium]
MVFVTGATGLVGSYLCRYLIMQGEQVRACYRAQSDFSLIADVRDKIEWVEGDILDPGSLEDALQGVEKVYHCAALISYVRSRHDDLMRINCEGTENVVNACLYAGIRKLVYVSSIAALGRTGKDGETIDEQTPWERKKLTSDYSISKFSAEREVWRGIAEGLQAVIINPSIILGSGKWDSGSCKLFTTVYIGFKFYTTGVTGYVDVRDVVQIAYRLMESDVSGERFILNSENIVYRDLLQMMAKELDVQGPKTHAGAFLSGLAWRADKLRSLFTGKEPTVTKQTARIANKTVYFDNHKICERLAYTFIPVADAVRDAAQAFLFEKDNGTYKPIPFEEPANRS